MKLELKLIIIRKLKMNAKIEDAKKFSYCRGCNAYRRSLALSSLPAEIIELIIPPVAVVSVLKTELDPLLLSLEDGGNIGIFFGAALFSSRKKDRKR